MWKVCLNSDIREMLLIGIWWQLGKLRKGCGRRLWEKRWGWGGLVLAHSEAGTISPSGGLMGFPGSLSFSPPT